MDVVFQAYGFLEIASQNEGDGCCFPGLWMFLTLFSPSKGDGCLPGLGMFPKLLSPSKRDGRCFPGLWVFKTPSEEDGYFLYLVVVVVYPGFPE